MKSCTSSVQTVNSIQASSSCKATVNVPGRLRPCSIRPFQANSRPIHKRSERRGSATPARAFFGRGQSATPGLSDNAWEQNKQRVKYSPLNRDTEVDVCVVGAGFAGLTAAYCLAQAGRL